MGVRGLLRKAGIASGDRRRSPRVRCRFHCAIQGEGRTIRARVLDVSEGGLCVLSPVSFAPRRPLRIKIDVPSLGPVAVEALAWHLREVESSRSGRKAWSIGMMISKAGPEFAALLPDGVDDPGAEVNALASQLIQTVDTQVSDPGEGDGGSEEDSLSAAELDAPDLELRSPAKEETASAKGSAPDDAMQMFRVRVKTLTGPRTRTLTLGAVSAAEARELAEAELRGEWKVLEVKPA